LPLFFNRPIIEQNRRKVGSTMTEEKKEVVLDPLMCLTDIREYDVPYTMRVAIDLDIRVGAWYIVSPISGMDICEVDWQKDFLELCEPRILAFDIECEKSPLKFPNAENDKIFMISYMVANQGYLIINREIVSKDVDDFEYTPKPNFPGKVFHLFVVSFFFVSFLRWSLGPFKVFNVENEEKVLRKFIEHIQEIKPHIVVTYNGDFFDFPYVEKRCSKYSSLGLYTSLGLRSSKLLFL
jgi:DNA polymerase epsilon subunit 1